MGSVEEGGSFSPWFSHPLALGLCPPSLVSHHPARTDPSGPGVPSSAQIPLIAATCGRLWPVEPSFWRSPGAERPHWAPFFWLRDAGSVPSPRQAFAEGICQEQLKVRHFTRITHANTCSTGSLAEGLTLLPRADEAILPQPAARHPDPPQLRADPLAAVQGGFGKLAVFSGINQAPPRCVAQAPSIHLVPPPVLG